MNNLVIAEIALSTIIGFTAGFLCRKWIADKKEMEYIEDAIDRATETITKLRLENEALKK